MYSNVKISMLTLCMLGKNFSRRHFKIFSYSSSKIGFDTACKLSPKETICMKCQILCSRKNKKNIISLLSAESVHFVVSVKEFKCSNIWDGINTECSLSSAVFFFLEQAKFHCMD